MGIDEALYKACEDNRKLEDELIEKDKEIKRLQNIINELEKDLKNKIEEDRLNILSNPHWLYVLDKLKELKGE